MTVNFGFGKVIILVAAAFWAAVLVWAVSTIIFDASTVYWDEPGVYDVPSKEGKKYVDPVTGEIDQTVQINIDNERCSEFYFGGISVGKPGITDAIQITSGTTATYLFIENLTFDGLRTTTFNLDNSYINTLNATSSVEVAGHSVTPTMTTVSDISVGSLRDTISYRKTSGNTDRIIIDIGSTSDSTCKSVTFKDVETAVGGVNLDYVKVGTLTLKNIEVGDDGDVNSPDFHIATSTKIMTMNDEIADVGIENK
jgi:hypothetical protein